MSFNSIEFILIFPLIFLLHWAIPSRCKQLRKIFLILVSYLLYMNWKPSFAIVLFVVTMITYIGGSLMDGNIKKGKKTHLIWLFALLGILPLLVFKYYNFLNDSLSAGLLFLGLQFQLPGLNWAIPIGISFFTFQAMGYMLDVYHGRIKAEKNLFDYILFISFFPQIVSGPISKASDLLPQIKMERTFDPNQATSGLRNLLWGMFLKVVLADRAGIYVDTVFGAYEKFSGVGCAIASILYSIQIYADFAGYSLMAMGVGKLLGFNLINNFRRPYLAICVTDFWRRWHISLTQWLTQQIYIPLGGSRCSKRRTYFNIFVTFLISGIWHGANWTFIVWGGIHGLFQVLEKTLRWNTTESRAFVRILRIALTFLVVTLAWTIFRSPSLVDAMDFIGRYVSFSGKHIADMVTLIYVMLAVIPLIIVEVSQEYASLLYLRLRSNVIIRWVVYVFVLAMILLQGVEDGGSFIYVSF